MHDVYFCCAAVGGTILTLQTALSLLGVGHHDADSGLDELHDHVVGQAHDPSDAFLKLFTLKSIVACLTFFGLAGLAAQQSGMASSSALLISLLAGASALWIVAWLMTQLSRLQSRGNIQLANAVGQSGKVYLHIPARKEGLGKVTVEVQGRTLELKAITSGREIETGTPVKVVALREPDVFEVVALADLAT